MTEHADDSTYFKKWYREHGEDLNSSRREKYQNDSSYREKTLKQNRESRERRRRENQEKKRLQASLKKTKAAKSWKSVNMEIDDGHGNKVVQTLFTIGAVAKALDCSVQALRLWERKGVIEETPHRYSKGDRLYTLAQIEELRRHLTESGRIGRSKVRDRPFPYTERNIRLSNRKRPKLTKLFKIGILSKMTGRTVVTLEQLEQRGALPETPFRVSGTGYRLYTPAMLEAVKQLFDKYGGELRGDDARRAFHDEVYAAWKKLGVVGAEIV